METVKISSLGEHEIVTREALQELFDINFGIDEGMILLDIPNHPTTRRVTIPKSQVVDYVFKAVGDGLGEIYVRDDKDRVDCFTISS